MNWRFDLMRVDFCETKGCGMELDERGRCQRCRERHWAQLASMLRERVEQIRDQRDLEQDQVDMENRG
jgi:hypothetical protein